MQKYFTDKHQLMENYKIKREKNKDVHLHLSGWRAFANSWWGWITMFVMYIVATVPPINLVNMVQLSLVLLLCLMNLMSPGLNLLRLGWHFVTVIQGVLLVACYIIQFPLVSTFISKYYNNLDNRVCVPIMLPELMQQFASNTFGGLFITLIGQTIAFMMAIVMLNVVIPGRRIRRKHRMHKNRNDVEAAAQLAAKARMTLPSTTEDFFELSEASPIPPSEAPAVGLDAREEIKPEAISKMESHTSVASQTSQTQEDGEQHALCSKACLQMVLARTKKLGWHIALFIISTICEFSTEILVVASIVAGLVPSYGSNTTNWTGDVLSFVYLLIPFLYLCVHGTCCQFKKSRIRRKTSMRKLRGSFNSPPAVIWFSMFAVAAVSILANYTFQFQFFRPRRDWTKTSVFFKIYPENVSIASSENPRKVSSCEDLNLETILHGAGHQSFENATYKMCKEHPDNCCNAIGMYDIVQLEGKGETLSGSGYKCALNKDDPRWLHLKSRLCAPKVKVSEAQAIPSISPFDSHCFTNLSLAAELDNKIWNAQKMFGYLGIYPLDTLGRVFVNSSAETGGVGNITHENLELFIATGWQLWLLMLKPFLVILVVLGVRQTQNQKLKWIRIGRINTIYQQTERDVFSVHPDDPSVLARSWIYCRDYAKTIWRLTLEREFTFFRIAFMMLIVIGAIAHISAVSVVYMLILGICILGNPSSKKFLNKPWWYVFLCILLIVLVLFRYSLSMGFPAWPMDITSCKQALQLAGCEYAGKAACLACNKSKWEEENNKIADNCRSDPQDVTEYCIGNSYFSRVLNNIDPEYQHWLDLSHVGLTALMIDSLAALLAKRLQILASRPKIMRSEPLIDPFKRENPAKETVVIKLILVYSAQVQ